MHVLKKKLFVFVVLFMLILSTIPCFAAEEDYQCLLLDEANLFSPEEEAALLDIMEDSLAYGNVMFLTTDSHDYITTYSLATNRYLEQFGTDGVIFVIDLRDRMLWISGMLDLQYVITDNYCETITDNVYTYATDGDYFTCSSIAFEQIHDVLEGKDIPMPMKYICNFLLSISFALVINYFLARLLSIKTKPSQKELRTNMLSHFEVKDANATFFRETRAYRSRSSGGGIGGGGGGGGGGSCSSGGGHRF